MTVWIKSGIIIEITKNINKKQFNHNFVFYTM